MFPNIPPAIGVAIKSDHLRALTLVSRVDADS